MFIQLIRPEWRLPNGSNDTLMRLLPLPGRAGELLKNVNRFLGRLITKGAGFTHVNAATAPTNNFGTAEGGVEFGAGLNLADTMPHGESETPALMPVLPIRAKRGRIGKMLAVMGRARDGSPLSLPGALNGYPQAVRGRRPRMTSMGHGKDDREHSIDRRDRHLERSARRGAPSCGRGAPVRH